MRLTDLEAEDLRYLWMSYAADLGIRSVHGAVERALLLRSPPRDLRRPVVEELERAGGRSTETRIVRIVTLERWGTRREVVQAIARLIADRRAERCATERPEPHSTCAVRNTGRTCSHPCASCEWTGFELRLIAGEVRRPIPRATKQEAQARAWLAHDEALERQLHELAVHDTPGSKGATRDELLGAKQRQSVERARAALRKLTPFEVRVLEQVYGGHWANETAVVDAVRAMVGGSKPRAIASIDQACAAYRVARAKGGES
jgi:hypothetical protein